MVPRHGGGAWTPARARAERRRRGPMCCRRRHSRRNAPRGPQMVHGATAESHRVPTAGSRVTAGPRPRGSTSPPEPPHCDFRWLRRVLRVAQAGLPRPSQVEGEPREGTAAGLSLPRCAMGAPLFYPHSRLGSAGGGQLCVSCGCRPVDLEARPEARVVRAPIPLPAAPASDLDRHRCHQRTTWRRW